MSNILRDKYNRQHTYLRISLTERCNLRCTYCMPAEGITLSPKENLMSFEEVYTIAKLFVDHGVTKIRLTGGEPLVRKDIPIILEKLSSLPVELSITSNGVTIDRYIDILTRHGVKKINVSLDSLRVDRVKEITRRDCFEKVYENISTLIATGFSVKINVVLIKNFNEDEIIDFINLSKTWPISVRFIEFMPFDGNRWNLEKVVSLKEILDKVESHFGKGHLNRLEDAAHDTSKNYKIQGYEGSFAIISSVTNPFCDSCNRLRLTANGRLKNCLFSTQESDLLTALRAGTPIAPIIEKAVLGKYKVRGGMNTLQDIKNPKSHPKNRSMITIGG